MRQRQLIACETDDGAGKARKPNVGIITHVDLERSAHLPLDNLVTLLSPLACTLIIITGDDYNGRAHEIEIVRTTAKRRGSLIAKIFEQALAHLRISRTLLKLRDRIDVLVFFNGAGLTMPLIVARSFNIKCIIVLTNAGTGPVIKAIKESGVRGQSGEIIRLHIQALLEQASRFFADNLVVYSQSVIDQMRLHRYANKTVIVHKYVLDYDAYDMQTSVDKRHDVIGYVGRLNSEKGVLNLIEAIPEVVDELPSVRFVIIGEGNLHDEIQASIKRNNLTEIVELTGWIPPDELPRRLNTFKLVVIPSYSETGPNIMFESMACGTPVLATRVGSVTDAIKDGETGFLLENRSPRCIARNVIRAISYPRLEQIGKNAHTLVREEFTVAKASESWKEILRYQLPH